MRMLVLSAFTVIIPKSITSISPVMPSSLRMNVLVVPLIDTFVVLIVAYVATSHCPFLPVVAIAGHRWQRHVGV